MSEAPRPPLDADAARFLRPGEQMFCYACRASGVCRLGLKEVAPYGERGMRALVRCPESHEDLPGLAHSGWAAAAFDETLGHLGPLNKALTVTGTLSVETFEPAPVGRDLEIRAWVDRVEGRRWFLEAEMLYAGARLALAHGVFIERRPDHFHSNQLWLQSQDPAAGPPDPQA